MRCCLPAAGNWVTFIGLDVIPSGAPRALQRSSRTLCWMADRACLLQCCTPSPPHPHSDCPSPPLSLTFPSSAVGAVAAGDNRGRLFVFDPRLSGPVATLQLAKKKDKVRAAASAAAAAHGLTRSRHLTEADWSAKSAVHRGLPGLSAAAPSRPLPPPPCTGATSPAHRPCPLAAADPERARQPRGQPPAAGGGQRLPGAPA